MVGREGTEVLRVEYYFWFLIFLLRFFCLKSKWCHSFSNTGSRPGSNIGVWDRFCKQLFFSMSCLWAGPQNSHWSFSTMLFLFWDTISAFKLETANSCYKQNFQVRGDCLKKQNGNECNKRYRYPCFLIFFYAENDIQLLKEFAFSLK